MPCMPPVVRMLRMLRMLRIPYTPPVVRKALRRDDFPCWSIWPMRRLSALWRSALQALFVRGTVSNACRMA